ncbi:helicase associated domain-containing protein [Streptomyces sp. NBC_01614]|uniref:Helicase associated domain-containing protein n=1 Tax=Streptomyces sp. NBC_00180 TaxID=2903632 RepID=A0AAU1I9K4_9ACTN
MPGACSRAVSGRSAKSLVSPCSANCGPISLSTASISPLLEASGITPPPPEQEKPAKPPKTSSGAFERGVAALAQYKERKRHVTVPRGHVRTAGSGTEVRLGVWVMNQKSRREKLSTDKLTALAALGLNWASAGVFSAG